MYEVQPRLLKRHKYCWAKKDQKGGLLGDIVAIECTLREVRNTLDVEGKEAMRPLYHGLHGEFEREGPMHLERQRQMTFVKCERALLRMRRCVELLLGNFPHFEHGPKSTRLSLLHILEGWTWRVYTAQRSYRCIDWSDKDFLAAYLRYNVSMGFPKIEKVLNCKIHWRWIPLQEFSSLLVSKQFQSLLQSPLIHTRHVHHRLSRRG